VSKTSLGETAPDQQDETLDGRSPSPRAPGEPPPTIDRYLILGIVGEGAMYVDPMDPDAIARAVQWLLTHPSEAAAMGAAGRAAVRETLHWDREAATLKQLYARVVGPPRSGG